MVQFGCVRKFAEAHTLTGACVPQRTCDDICIRAVYVMHLGVSNNPNGEKGKGDLGKGGEGSGVDKAARWLTILIALMVSRRLVVSWMGVTVLVEGAGISAEVGVYVSYWRMYASRHILQQTCTV